MSKSQYQQPPLPGMGGRGVPIDTELSIRELIAAGKTKTALENAKQFHKTEHSEASTRVLQSAYEARIRSLFDQDLRTEALSLIDVAIEKLPGSKGRLDALRNSGLVAAGDLGPLLAPLADPAIAPGTRQAIDEQIRAQAVDLTAIAGCSLLPAEHPLRRAAADLEMAFQQVTSGPVTDEQIALTSVSHRSPLAPWKMLIRAIATFYRGEDENCRSCLAAITEGSAPSRLAPSIFTMLGDPLNTAPVLNQAASALVGQVQGELSSVRRAFRDLDSAFSGSLGDGTLYKAMRSAMHECQSKMPALTERLRLLVSVRAEIVGLDEKRTQSALGGAARRDASYYRILALAMEGSPEPDDLIYACELWEEFAELAVKEGWFPAKGLEMATLYLHMATVLSSLPPSMLMRGGVPDNLLPEALFQRAFEMDPRPEIYANRLRLALRTSTRAAEKVAHEWSKAYPKDVAPLLFLIDKAEKRKAYPTALSLLERAEVLDSVNPAVRATRLRLLVNAAIRHLQQKKPHLAEQKITAFEALPQAQHGRRMAFCWAVRGLIARAAGDETAAERAMERLTAALGCAIAGELLMCGIGQLAKMRGSTKLPVPDSLTAEERREVPRAVAKASGLALELGLTKFGVPVSYFDELETQFPVVKADLDVASLVVLAKAGLASDRPQLTWRTTAEGLKRGESTAGKFLYLRSLHLPLGRYDRRSVLFAAAAELGRFYGDPVLVEQSLMEVAENPRLDSLTLKMEQVREVIQKEMAAIEKSISMGPQPDYDHLFAGSQFGGARGVEPDDFEDDFEDGDEDEDEEDDGYGLDDSFPDVPQLSDSEIRKMVKGTAPKGTPPFLINMLVGILKDAMKTGVSPTEVLARLTAGMEASGKPDRKGRK